MDTPISLNQIGLYNPQRQSAEITEKLFVVRQKLFSHILNKLLKEKENSIPQHHLIIGQRGMGKTTMLKRLEVELHKEQYQQQFIPLLFPEEQYNVQDLGEFWLNCLDALADSLELEKYPSKTITAIDKEVKVLSRKSPEELSDETYKYLMNTCRNLHRRPVLLVDNIGLVFNRLIKNDQYKLRKLLSENGAPIIVSAGVAVSRDVADYNAPFYDFFQIQYLRKLNFKEFVELLKNLATVTHSDESVFISIEQNGPRQKSLLELTGGNPRTTVMLFKLIVKGFSSNINDDLEALVDEITPLYKAKYEELSTQQQLIVDAIAMNWDAISLKALSADTRFSGGQLSPQLKRLIEEGWIDTTPAYEAKGNAYFISERFFNVWFLMRRSSRRQKEKIYCLSRFLECLYGKEEIEKISETFLENEIKDLQDILVGCALAESLRRNMHDKSILMEDKTYYGALNLSKKNKKILEQFDIPENYKTKKDEKTPEAFFSAYPDLELVNKGGELLNKHQYKEAKKCFDKAIKINPTNYLAWKWRGITLNDMGYYNQALANYDQAIKLNPEEPSTYYWKGITLATQQQYRKSIVFFDYAIELDPEDEYLFLSKSFSLEKLNLYEESLSCSDKAIEINPYNEISWYNKALTLIELQQYEEASKAFEQALSLNSESLTYKFNLIFLYRDILGELNKATTLFNSIDEQEILKDGDKDDHCLYLLHKTLFELYKRNEGTAKSYLLETFDDLEENDNVSSIANSKWWERFGTVVIKLNYAQWLLSILEERRYNIILSPYYTAIQALDIEKNSKKGVEQAEVFLKNKAVEVSEPARIIINNMKKYMN